MQLKLFLSTMLRDILVHHSKIFIASFLLFTSTQKIFSIDLNQLNLDPGFEISIFAKNNNASKIISVVDGEKIDIKK